MKWLVALPIVLAMPLAAQIGGRPTRPKVQRPDGLVWEVIRRNCVACHGIDDYAFYAQDRAAWQKLIADKHKPTLVDMRERGAPLSDEELERLVEWLARVWGTNQDKWARLTRPSLARSASSFAGLPSRQCCCPRKHRPRGRPNPF